MNNRVVHCKREPFDVYIGRPSKWGNPFSHKSNTLAKYKVDTVEEAVAKYELWVKTQPEIINSLHELNGKILGCWCKIKGDEPCHGDILIKMIDQYKDNFLAGGKGLPEHLNSRLQPPLWLKQPEENDDLGMHIYLLFSLYPDIIEHNFDDLSTMSDNEKKNIVKKINSKLKITPISKNLEFIMDNTKVVSKEGAAMTVRTCPIPPEIQKSINKSLRERKNRGPLL